MLGTNCGNFHFSSQTSQSLHFCHGRYVVALTYCNCFLVDNGTREGLDKFLKAASSEPETVMHYEFMQDYKVWH